VPPDAWRGGVLFVHAHPDDESMGTGGSIARLVAGGHRVDLVTCTDGAEGEIHDPELDPEEARPRLVAIRAAELACSLDALGDGAVRHHLLGYRDSGMMDTDANHHPESFWQADLGLAAEKLIGIVRAAEPAAIVSYDENGQYGHPDHINANRVAVAAYEAVESVDRLYEVAFNREAWFALMSEMRERGITLPWGMDEVLDPARADAATPAALPRAADELNPSNVQALRHVETAIGEGERPPEDFGTPDALVTTRIDVSAFLDRKRASMACHRTQRQDLGWMLELPHDLADRAMTTEHYVLRRRRSAAVADGYREGWLLETDHAGGPA
jgi:LmbE family N-acetylglucosaminyl deacetylase